MKLKLLSLLLVLCYAGYNPQSAGATDSEQILSPLQGGGTKESPYLIHNKEELQCLRQYMEKHEDFTIGKYFRLEADIHLNSQILNEEGTEIVADTTRLSQWSPIGEGETLQPYHAFQGDFDGNGHTIYGIYINAPTTKNRGLFGYIHRNGVVRNLCIADSYIAGTAAVGAVCGQCHEGQIVNCESRAIIVSTGATIQAGGIAGSISGSKGRIVHCRNYGQVIGHSVADEYGQMYNCYIGGICGDVSSGKVDSCVNAGNVLSKDWGAVGGVTGTVTGGAAVRWCTNKGDVSSNVSANIGGIAGNNWQLIYECTNEGQIVATTKDSDIGGIAGKSSFNSRINKSVNKADIICQLPNVRVGGIVGNMDGGRNDYGTYYTPIVNGCINEGTIQTTDPSCQAGGISGKNYCAEIHDSENHGHVVSMSSAGGISPLCEYHSYISGCINTGRIEAPQYAGGIVAHTNASISGSWNSGHISNIGDKGYAGGIAGYTNSSVSNCFNTGEVSNTKTGGGIVGYNDYKSYISNSYNSGHIHTDKNSAALAGIGGGNGTVTKSYNVGTVSVSGDNSTVAGIVNNTWVSFDGHGNRSGSTVENCYNAGQVHALGANNKAGNITGSYEEYNTYMLFSRCYYLNGMLQGSDYTCNDMTNTYITAIDEAELKTLASNLNTKDYWWDDTPDAFVQGYSRPVINITGEENNHMAFHVATINGDSTYIDLGFPIDNMFFTTDSTGLVLNAFNVIRDNNVRHAMLVDGKDFNIPTTLKAQSITYTRRMIATHGTGCLPFALDSEDFPTGMILMTPQEVQSDATVPVSRKQEMKAGEPFIFQIPEGMTEWTVEKHDAEIVKEPTNGGVLCGIFSRQDRWTEDCYLPTDETLLYRQAQDKETLPAFRAFFKVPGITDGTLQLTENDITAITEAQTSNTYITATNHNIIIGNAMGKSVSILSVTGEVIFSTPACRENVSVPVYKDGIYIINIDGQSKKILIQRESGTRI